MQRSMEHCPTCAGLEEKIELNYEKGAVRPSLLAQLEIVATRRTEDGSHAWCERSTLVCPTCGTFYAALRSKDEGESFMDPTEDCEAIARLSVHAAREALEPLEEARARAERTALAARTPRLIDELATLLGAGTAPSWHIQKHAIVCVMEAYLLAGDDDRLERTLLGHPDPVVRVETALELLQRVIWPPSGEGESSLGAVLQRAGRAFVTTRSPVPSLATVLAEPPRPSLALDDDGRSLHPTDTHRAAARALGMAARAKLAVDEATVERLATLLGGSEGQRFDAAWALIYGLDGSPSPLRVLRDVLGRCSPEVLASPVVRMLADGVQRRTQPA